MIQANPKFAETIIWSRLARWKEKELNPSARKEETFVRVLFHHVGLETQQVTVKSAGSFGVGDCQDNVIQTRSLHDEFLLRL
jgi:hypothetical protein